MSLKISFAKELIPGQEQLRLSLQNNFLGKAAENGDPAAATPLINDLSRKDFMPEQYKKTWLLVGKTVATGLPLKKVTESWTWKRVAKYAGALVGTAVTGYSLYKLYQHRTVSVEEKKDETSRAEEKTTKPEDQRRQTENARIMFNRSGALFHAAWSSTSANCKT